MSRLGGMMRSTRPKKLTPKQPIPIFREDQIDIAEDDPQTTLQSIETGVEKAEETEFHLQAAINASAFGKVAQAHIPTPETKVSSLQYGKLYADNFSQPATYIRFSSTVEDCCGCGYNLVEEDDVALKIMNQKCDASSQCTEDQFEVVMAFFEETAQTKQPFAAVDSPPVVTYPEMEECFDGFVDEKTRKFAKDIYEHWKRRRTALGNRPLQPSLKFETGQDTDDGDPYVCFRRREVRQIRKTRGRDAQSVDKLRRLRNELEDARQLVSMVRQREVARKEQFASERQIFLQRAEVKEMKRKLGIKDDDEDLINQKPKKKPVDVPAINRPTAPQLRIPQRLGGHPGDDLQQLEDLQAEKENAILREIKQSIAKHAEWNEGYVDWTTTPLTPKSDHISDPDFRPAITTEYLPTPPASESSDPLTDGPSPELVDKPSMVIRARTPLEDEPSRNMPSFRRRVGRGGRMLIDRRNLPFRDKTNVDPVKLDRFKYDHDDDDMEPVYEKDEWDLHVMQHRALLAIRSREQIAAHAQLQAQGARRLQGVEGRAPSGQPVSSSANLALKGPQNGT